MYEFNRLAFGVKTSPYVVLHTVKQLISTDIYMDDLVCSVPSEEEAHRNDLESRFWFPVPGSSCTKRIILSTVARCYDPVGLVAPFILFLKLLIKELWKLKIGWDEIFQKWSKLKDEWSAFEKIQFSRYMGTVRTSPVMLVAFADASMDGYGAVVYVRTVTENGEITVNLLCAKLKVSPFKVVTIPRLELVAVLLLSREERVSEESGEDVDSIKCLVSTEDTERHPLYDMVMRSSSYITIFRVTVWVLHFVKILTVKSFITASDMNRAELVLVRIVPGKYFKLDIKLLNLGQEISNRLRKLNPFLQNKILMVGGRLENAPLTFVTRHPIILPGPYLMEVILRQKYWILGVRNAIGQRVHACNKCFRLKSKTINPPMADLTTSRLLQAKVFTHTGIDYFGPFNITLGRRRGTQVYKGYVCLFVDDKSKNEFTVKDSKAKSMIVQCITDKHLDLVKDSKSSKEMNKALQDAFERKSVFTKLTLKKKSLTLKLKRNEKLEDHFLIFDTLIRDLESADSKLEEEDKVCHLLLSLNEEFESVITAIETMSSTTVSMDFVKSRLLDEELKIKAKFE
ncbi:hypothetical protein JTB14_008186 [Gonioctena quinquepunctata]|nr:hypothetical protein JTB14_008186 [Gonioctena quinquepunctata]